MSLNFIANQEIYLLDSSGHTQRVLMRISLPVERTDELGRKLWECAPRLDGLVEIKKCVSSFSSLGAVILATASLRRLLRDFAKGRRILLGSPSKPGEPDPEGEVTLKDLFELH
jgi:hypothetical protein